MSADRSASIMGRHLLLLVLTLSWPPGPASQTSAEQERWQRATRERIEALPLSREEKDRLYQQQLQALKPGPAGNEKWLKAREIYYRIVGEYADRTSLDTHGDARVTDRVEIEFVLDPRTLMHKGDIVIRNERSQIEDVQPGIKGCRAPTLHGPFEFYTLEAVEPLVPGGPLGPLAQVRFVREYPSMTVAHVCTASRRVEARTERETRPLRIPLTGEFLQRKADTIVVKELGWTWTYRATPR